MRRISAAALALLALGLSAPRPAAAQPSVEEALEQFYGARFDRAAEVLDSVLASPELDLETAVEAHRYRAALYLLSGDDVEARRHARAAVALDPAVRAPEGVSRAESVFAAARASLPDAPTRLELRAREVADGRLVEAEAAPFVPALFGELALACGELDTRGEGPRVELTVTADAALVCEAVATSSGGAILLRRSLALEGAPAGSDDDVLLWGLLGGGGGALVLAAIVIVAVATSSGGIRFDSVDVQW